VSEPYAENTQQDESGSVTVALSTGTLLRQARESAGLSREEVSSRLRLRLDLIRALEEDDAANLPPATFVSGYLRSYARLLEIDVEPLLAGFEGRSEAPSLVSPVMPPRQRRSSDLPVKLVTYLVILSLLLLLVAWWLTKRPQIQQAEPEEVAVVTPGGTVELTLPPADITAGQDVAPVTLETTEPAAIAEPVTPLPTPVVVAQAEIQLEATAAECWVDIKDASGKQIVYELLKQGATRTVRGQAPFDVFLGYAPGVTVYYQGQVFDHSKYQRNEVARFRLGKKSDNVAHSE